MVGVTRAIDEKEIYFELTNHDLISGTKLREMMYVINNDKLGFMYTKEEVRKFAKSCKGIVRELKHPSVTKLIQYGFKATAVYVYYKENPNVSLVDARKHVERLSIYMMTDCGNKAAKKNTETLS